MLGPGSATARGRESIGGARPRRVVLPPMWGQSPNPRSGKAFFWWSARSCAQVGHDVSLREQEGAGIGGLLEAHAAAGDGPVTLRDACGREVGAAGADDRERIGPGGPVRCRADARCGLEPQPVQSRRDTRDQPSRMCVGLRPSYYAREENVPQSCVVDQYSAGARGVPLLAAFSLMHLSPPPRVVSPIIYGRAPIEEADKGEQAWGGILQSREERLAGHRVLCRPAIPFSAKVTYGTGE